MEMHSPPHPGEVIKEIYLESNAQSSHTCARAMGVSLSTFSSLLNGSQNITPDLAQKLSTGLGGSPESWLRMQEIYDVWQLKIANASLTPK